MATENLARNEIEEMLSDYDEQVEAAAEPQEEQPVDEQPVETEQQDVEADVEVETDESADPRDLDEQPVEDEQPDVNEQPVVEQPVVEEPDDLAKLREQNEMLVKRIEELSAKVVNNSMVSPQMQQQAVEQAAKVSPQEQATQAIKNFLGDMTIDDLLESPETFNKLLNQVAMAAREQAVAEASERVMRAVPELVVGYTTRHTAMNKIVDEFYQENPDLAGVKQTVAAVANDIHSKNPELGVDEVFKMTAEETRKFLGLKKAALAQKPATAKRPAFAKQKTARRMEPQVSGLQKEINDLLSDVY